MVVTHQPKELSKLTQPIPGPRPAWSPCRFLGAKNECFSDRDYQTPASTSLKVCWVLEWNRIWTGCRLYHGCKHLLHDWNAFIRMLPIFAYFRDARGFAIKQRLSGAVDVSIQYTKRETWKFRTTSRHVISVPMTQVMCKWSIFLTVPSFIMEMVSSRSWSSMHDGSSRWLQ